jgi:hypothetical protein
MALQIVDLSSTCDRDSYAVLPNFQFERDAVEASLRALTRAPQLER